MRPLLLALTVLLVGAAGAQAASFRTPSGNIGCQYLPAPGSSAVNLRCDVQEVDRPAKRPASCEGDYGRAFELRGTGKARRLCVSDTALDPDARVLRYGTSRRFGPFTCTSRQSGLRCVSHSNGHGFSLSRATQRLF